MKLSIEVEILPDEVTLATELLATLRTLTDHIKGASPPVVKSVHELVQGIVAKLADDSKLDVVAAELGGMLSNPSFGEPTKVAEEISEAMHAIVFNVDLVKQQQSVMPYLQVLPKLPEPHKNKIRDGMIAKVLQHLTKKRPIDVDRIQFFGQAEAFAVLVMIDFVSVDGAAQTIEKLLNKQDSRSAAVTMLGKTVELCHDKLKTKCDPKHLANLCKALEKVTEESFAYDVQWINECMGWKQQGGQPLPSSSAPAGTAAASMPMPMPTASAPAAAPMQQQQPVFGPGPRGLSAMASYEGHTTTIFTMCYDPLHRTMTSGGKDGNVLVWNDAGQVIHKIDTPVHYVCSMDIHPRNNLLLMCGVATEQAQGPVPPCIAAYDTNRNWQQKAMLSRPDRSLISCLRCMGPDTDGFVTGETANTPGPTGAMSELVCYYDMGRSQSFENLQPVHVYTEHENLVTSVAINPTNSNIFVSASRDMTVRVWDKRMDKSVGMFGQANLDPNEPFKVKAHTEMITCVDAYDNTLISSGVDGLLCFWDFRTIGGSTGMASPPTCRMQVDGAPILKIALSAAPLPNVVAVSTFQGLYIVDFAQLSNPTTAPAAMFSEATHPFKPYHDLKWGSGAGGKPLLFTASENSRIDTYQMT